MTPLPMSRHGRLIPSLTLLAAMGAGTALAGEFRLGVDYAVEGTLREGVAWDEAGSGNLLGRLGTRMATPWGEFVQSGVSRYDSVAGTREVWRDQAYWHYTDPVTGLNYRAGDFRAGTTLGWIRSYDMTGVQFRRAQRKAFDTIQALTPDPALLRNVDPNTFNWEAMPSLPALDGSGPLAGGATEFGAQAGYLRLNPGTAQAGYAPSALVSAGLRYGVTGSITAETYTESTDRLLHQGAGLVGSLGQLGSVGLGASYSRQPGTRGGQWMASYRGGLGNLGYFAGTQMRSAGFQDALTHVRQQLDDAGTDYSRIDTVGVSWRLPEQRSDFQLNYVRLTPVGTPPVSRLVNLTHATQYDSRIGWYTSVYRDLDASAGYGMYVGVRVPLGRATRSEPGPTFDFSARGAPAASLRRSASSATLGSTGSFRVDQGVRVEAGLYDSYLRQTVW